MRLLAVIANIALLICVIVLIANHGLPENQGDIALFTAMVAAPVLSTIALLSHKIVQPPELLSLEIAARKAKLRKQIAEAEGDTPKSS